MIKNSGINTRNVIIGNMKKMYCLQIVDLEKMYYGCNMKIQFKLKLGNYFQKDYLEKIEKKDKNLTKVLKNINYFNLLYFYSITFTS